MRSFLTFLFFAAAASCLQAQETTGALPMSLRHGLDVHNVPTVQAARFDAEAAAADDAQREAANKLALYARFVEAPASLSTAGLWTELPGGDRVWRLRVSSPGAQAVELFFSDAYLPPEAQVHVYDEAMQQIIGGFTQMHVQPNGAFTTDMIFGGTCIVEYYEPAAGRGEGSLRLEKVAHAYRMVGDAQTGACEVDINCSEGANWTDERDAVVRIRVTIPTGLGSCTGTLMNNAALDCKGYILTAFHCTEESGDGDYATYQFRFRYQRPSCGSGSATGNNLLGCVRRAGSQDGGGTNGSDFSLLELTQSIPASYAPYWAGWDANGNAPVGGVSIHHPDGDVKKISTFTGTAISSSWLGIAQGSHWRLVWVTTANGHGVTEPGSSGSPLFNNFHHVVGTLTGGGSCCVAGACGDGTGPNAPDLYGKMSYHFSDANPNPPSEYLSEWLLPNGGPYMLNGSADPCGPIGISEEELLSPEVFPDPASDRLTVRLHGGLLGAGEIRLLDVSGRVVEVKRLSGGSTVEWDVSARPTGSYFLTVLRDGQRLATARVNVVH